MQNDYTYVVETKTFLKNVSLLGVVGKIFKYK